jgi:helicase
LSAPDTLRRADAIAAALNRGLNVEPIAWGELLAIAQQEIGSHQQRRILKEADGLYEEQAASRLIAAARIVQEVAERSAEEGEALEETGDQPRPLREEQHLLRLLSSCTFSMYGNFPSAAAVQRELNIESIKSEGQLLAFAVSNPRQLPFVLRASGLSEEAIEFLEKLNHFLSTGDKDVGSILVENFESLMSVKRPPAEVALLRSARLALRHIVTLAVANLFRRKCGDVFAAFVRGIILDKRPCLLPPQYTLIDQGILEECNNSIVTIPTSTGKTLLAELAIAARLLSPGDIAVYVAPYIALGRQVFYHFKQHAPVDVDVRGYFGSFNSHIEPLGVSALTIIVATPERLDAILRTQELYSRLRTIVFDEAHGIENGARGARLESLITRLRLQQSHHKQIRIILLSAVLTDVESVRLWLGNEAVHYHDTWRPTSRRLGIWMDNGELGWLYGTDPLRPSDREASHFIGRKKLPWPAQMQPAASFQGIAAQRPSAYLNAAFLARYLEASLGGPVLLACASKPSTRGLAAAVASELSEKDESNGERDALVQAIKHRYPHLSALASMVAKGVAYHNASLPSDVRTLIEDAIRTRALDFVAATTTLAEGVDLPFRITVLFDWLLGFGDEQAPMSPLLFRNIAGRCGRAGEFTEGDTIIFDNVLGDSAYTSPGRRREAQARLFSDPPALRSVIASDSLSEELKSEVRAVVSSQLLASIPENPNEDSLEKTWALATYAAFRSSPPISMTRELRNDLLRTDLGEPFARAASPLRLTALGLAANKSGFSPRTCRLLLQYLPSINLVASDATIAADLLLHFGACDEQSNYLLRAIAQKKRSTFYVKANDLPVIAAGWLEGSQLMEIFLALPKAKSSKAAITPSQWAVGKAEYEPVASQYDKFVDMTGYAFGGFLPWLLRAVGALAVFAPARVSEFNWTELGRRFETSRVTDTATIDQVSSSASRE